MSTEKCTEEVGSSLTISKSMWIKFSNVYFEPPDVSASAEGLSKYPDKFSVSINRVTRGGFDCTVNRFDCQTGWGQNPTITWEATGQQVPEATGRKNIETSTENTKTVKVVFSSKLSKLTSLVAWVEWDFTYPGRYSVEVHKQNANGFQCTVTRLDSNSGWNQDLNLLWNSVEC